MQVNRGLINGIYNPSTVQPVAVAIPSNYAPFDTTTAATAYSSITFGGGSSTGSPWFTTAINATNYIQTNANSQYVIYNVPSNMILAFINYDSGPIGGSIQVYGGNSGSFTLLATVSTLNSIDICSIFPVNLTGYTQIKILNVTGWVGFQGIGWTLASSVMWKSTYALDVSGSVNVSGAITTGNACSLRYWTVFGYTNSASAGTTTVGLPTGCVGTNIVGMYGTFTNGVYNFPFNHTLSTAGNTARSCTIFFDGTNINVVNGTGATNAYSCPFTVVIVTIS